MNSVTQGEAAALLNTVPPEQEIATEVRLEKYAYTVGGEDGKIDTIHQRVAGALAEHETDKKKWRKNFLQTLRDGFIPAGRINSSAGTDVKATLINCFVQPVGDAIHGFDHANYPGIYDALTQAAETMRRGGGVGYDFSRIRPIGAKVKGTNSNASGPISYMHVFDRSCQTVESAGARRGAQMGVMRFDHPDILDFVTAKTKEKTLTNFNISVGVSNEFMRAAEADEVIDLWHEAEPTDELKRAGAYQRADEKWVYAQIKARKLMDTIMRSTYDHAEPGILFLDRMNEDNNLYYCETIEATNPCAEQPLPPYGCCCLGSINLSLYVLNPFTAGARLDYDRLETTIEHSVRMLDNVLDATYWPLEQQKQEAMSKRRVGLGFTGLGDALIMLQLAYDSPEARNMAAQIAEFLRDHAYLASVKLAKERGAFPLFDADLYLTGGNFASRLPEHIKDEIRKHGIRNSHLLSIAPTGTISLAFADNASNGIEPPFSWTYTRKKRMADGTHKEYAVEDYAWRVYRHLGNDVTNLPPYFKTALEISAHAHEAMVAAVAPFVDTSISKTVNIPADYPYEDFQNLYYAAWRSGLKGLATYRPNSTTGSVLSVTTENQNETEKEVLDSQADIRIKIDAKIDPALASLKWPGRPELPSGSEGWVSNMIKHALGDFAVFVSHIPEENGGHPFEVWVNGNTVPSGLGAVAKTLSMDMRVKDKAWLDYKLKEISSVAGDDAFEMLMPPSGVMMPVPSVVAALSRLVAWRCFELNAIPGKDFNDPTPMMDSLLFRHEIKTTTDGTMSWTADIANPNTGDEFMVVMREMMVDGKKRPFSISLSGRYPKAYDGLARLLSIDMRIADPAWIGMKLRKLLNYSEPRADFLAWTPGAKKQRSYPSTIAYLAKVMIHRYAVLGILDEEGFPAGSQPFKDKQSEHTGKPCVECGKPTMKKDGCTFCPACGHVGSCG